MASDDAVPGGPAAPPEPARARVTTGFLTDATLCIGCRACEVACKEWNDVPETGFPAGGPPDDRPRALGASSWRHVLFVEGDRPADAGGEEHPFGWIFLSDVCKHCEVAGCLEACPTGSIVRTEFGSVYVQDDICNGCGYCVVSCPFGVIDRRERPLPGSGGAFKCTSCYDRQIDGLLPACVKVCPTESIRFGPLEDLRREAVSRLGALRDRGLAEARLYDPVESSVRGTHALFILPGSLREYGLPAHPVVPTSLLGEAWASALLTAAGSIVAAVLAFLLFRGRS